LDVYPHPADSRPDKARVRLADRVLSVRGRGSNQGDLRAYNERLLLSLIRRHGQLSKIELARMTGLSAQTASVIIRALESDDLLRRQAPVRGRKGQPSVPMSLNPDGALFFGLSVGRRNVELILIDLAGQVRFMVQDEYKYPTPAKIVSFTKAGVKRLTAKLPKTLVDRVTGLGLAMPFDMWAWADQAGAPEPALDAWKSVDLRAELSSQLGLDVHVQNDATAACGAELLFGNPGNARDFVYFYVGYFVGGGIVLDGSLFPGRSGNAGALGSMLVPGNQDGPVQLLQVASLAELERSVSRSGFDSSVFWTSPENWAFVQEHCEQWITVAGRSLAHAIISASSVIDFEAAIIDGWLPDTVRQRLVQQVQSQINTLVSEGLSLPDIRAGSVGVNATALGGAGQVLASQFLVD